MIFIIKSLFFLALCAGIQCAHQVSWLPCVFRDENVFKDDKGEIQTRTIHRDALLQFGQKEDAFPHPRSITFLVTGSRLDLQRYTEGVEEEQVECEIYRFSTRGTHVRWPVKGEEEYSCWFTCTLRHKKDLFTVTGFLRQPTDQPPSGQPDFYSWPVIKDGDVLTTTVALVTETQTPVARASQGSKTTLHCQFSVDHKAPHVTVEWHRYLQGQRKELFSYNSQTGETRGSGVELTKLIGGDASLTIPHAKIDLEGNYHCSVSLNPLYASLPISLKIEEAPEVFLDVGSTLSLQEGEVQKIKCWAKNYYPLDVEIFWYSEELTASGQTLGASRTRVPHNSVRLSHTKNNDETYTVSAYFYLNARLRDSGRQFTCSISHPSLKEPITKNFILTVKQPSFWMLYLVVDLFLVYIVYKMLPYLRLGKRSILKRPY